jgi:hypothetical protein
MTIIAIIIGAIVLLLGLVYVADKTRPGRKFLLKYACTVRKLLEKVGLSSPMTDEEKAKYGNAKPWYK